MALRALKTDEEIGHVPLDKPVLIELPAGINLGDDDVGNDDIAAKGKKVEPEGEDDGAKKLQEQLEAAQAAQKLEREGRERAEREAADAKRLADQRTREAADALKRTVSLEGDIISGGLSAAQAELAAAEAELERAGEAGDYKAMAKAQSRIGRASAQIVNLESGAAEVAERKEAKVEPRQETPPQRSFEDNVRANAGLLRTEQDWMIKNKTSFDDPDFNKKLEFAYAGAMQKGIVRGSADYFDHIERATGLKAAPAAEERDERDISVQAPVTRNERGTDGRSSNGKVMLTPEEREICKSMGLSEIEYARQKVAFEVARKADPEKYSARG